MQQRQQMDYGALEAISPVFSPMVAELKSSYQHRCVDALLRWPQGVVSGQALSQQAAPSCMQHEANAARSLRQSGTLIP